MSARSRAVHAFALAAVLLATALVHRWLLAEGSTARADAVVSIQTAAGPVPLEQIESVTLVADTDDDDEDGTSDRDQAPPVAEEDLVSLVIPARSNVRLSVDGPLRLLDGSTAAREIRNRRGRERRIFLQATGPGAGTLVVDDGRGGPRQVPVASIGLSFLSGPDNRPLTAGDSVAVSHHITNDASLPRRFEWGGTIGDPDALRVEVTDATASHDRVEAAIASVDASGRVRHRQRLTLRRDTPGDPYRSEWLRLVADELDAHAPGVAHRTLRVALRDRVVLEYRTARGIVTQGVRVGLAGPHTGPQTALQATLRIRIMRVAPGGVPVIGDTDEGALRLGHDQVAIANEAWLQCLVGFGDPATADIAVVDPPPPSLVAIADGNGLPARGGGDIRLVVDGRPVGPIATRPGASPLDTALDVADALERAGFVGRVTTNPPAEFAAGPSADVLVTNAEGALAVVAPPHGRAVSTDPRQSVTIGAVELSDGLLEFDNMNAAAGTLEERALVKALADDDPATIDLFIVNRFSAGTRQGEAFIEADGGPIVNVVLLDRNGIRQQRNAWTVAHELGHVLLDQPFHPDNFGRDRPWLLLDSDASVGLVTGPKRLTEAECRRARALSGPNAVPTLLRPLSADSGG